MSESHFTREVNDRRKVIKDLAAKIKNDIHIVKTGNHLGLEDEERSKVEDRGEVIASLTLCYRHLEDASMRLGKAIQAHDGGVSVYDKATTVGAE